MSMLDGPTDATTWESVRQHSERVLEYLRTTNDPNETGSAGQTCLMVAMTLHGLDNSSTVVQSLLDRGADPNNGSPLIIFEMFMTFYEEATPLQWMIQAGLRLNDVYSPDPEALPSREIVPFTLLDYALSVNSYLDRRKKSTKRIGRKVAPLTGRRKFVADVIALLKSHGAKQAADLDPAPS